MYLQIFCVSSTWAEQKLYIGLTFKTIMLWFNDTTDPGGAQEEKLRKEETRFENSGLKNTFCMKIKG